MTVGVIDYGAGNLFSLCSALKKIGAEVIVSDTPRELGKADRYILPGVGAFAGAMEKLSGSGLIGFIKDIALSGRKLMGICLGMQLLLNTSYEFGVHSGLGLISGKVRPIADISKEVKIPHIGWNGLCVYPHPIFNGVKNGDYVYFVHSYYCDCKSVIATTEYGGTITAAIAKDNICGCQFHPEKSGRLGQKILQNFLEW